MTGRPRSADLMVVTSHMGEGGTQRVIASMLWELERRGVNIVLVLTNPGASWSNAYSLPERITVVEHRRLVRPKSYFKVVGICNVVASFLKLRAEVRAQRPKAVLSLLCSTNIRVIAACMGLRVGRLVVSERNNPARQQFPRYQAVGRRFLYRYADLVTANSPGALDWLAKIAPRSKLALLPNPVAIPAERKRRVVPDQPIRLLFVGRLVPQKCVEQVVKAVAILRSEGLAGALTIVGDGPERHRLQRIATRENVSDSVFFAGYVESVDAFYASCDGFVLMSDYEGTPNALLEAMAWGMTCIVSSGANEVAQVVEHGTNGIVVNDSSPVSLASSIREAYSDQRLWVKLGNNARRTVAEFDVTRTAAIWQNLLGV